MATGELLYRDYEMPPGYSMKLFWDSMDERPTPTLIRVQYLRERRRENRRVQNNSRKDKAMVRG